MMNWPPGAHASTFGGNPVSVAAALVTIELLEQELMENAARIGRTLMDRMRDWPARFPIVGDVRGLGLMIGIEMVRDQETKERAPELRDRARAARVRARAADARRGQNSIRLCPPLVITQDQADCALDTLEECLTILVRDRESSTSAAGLTNIPVPSESTAIPERAPTCSATSTAFPIRSPTARSTACAPST